MFQARSLHPNEFDLSLPVLTGLGISEIPSFSPRPVLPPPCGQSLCPLTHLSMQGHYMSFSSRNPRGEMPWLRASWTLFSTIKAHKLCSGPQVVLCKRVTDVSREGEGGRVWALMISSNPASLLPLNSASSHASDPSGVPGSGAALSTSLSSSLSPFETPAVSRKDKHVSPMKRYHFSDDTLLAPISQAQILCMHFDLLL